MARKPLDLPMQVAKQFEKDMRAYHAEPNAIKRDEIASRQLHALLGFQRPREKKLRVHDVKEMFEAMKDHA
jgi:septin family protein